jgi:glucose-1-phosphate adenylyltransferase
LPVEDVVTLILGGGRGYRLYPLTMLRSEPAVPLAGKYRLIDIPLSNCINSGLRRIFVVTQFESVSLHRHIANTYKFDPFSRGFVEVLAARQTNDAADWYQGTADAVRQNIRYLYSEAARDVLVLYGDQVYRMDFQQLIRQHRARQADVTVAVAPVSRARAPTLGILRLDDADRVTTFVEKPQTSRQLDELRLPPGWLEQRGVSSAGGREYLANTGMYLFNFGALLQMLNAQASATDLVREVFPPALAAGRIQAYLFDGYWEDLGSIGSYFDAHLALTGDHPPFDFHSPEGVIYTRMRYLPASRISGARLQNCLISDGCVVGAGAELERCILGVRGQIGRNVRLQSAIYIGADEYETDADRAENRRRGRPNLGIGDGAVIERAILDKDCRVGRNVRIVNERGLQEAEGDNYVIRDGIVVIPNGAVVPDGTVI